MKSKMMARRIKEEDDGDPDIQESSVFLAILLIEFKLVHIHILR